jgi:hypothetical protein
VGLWELVASGGLPALTKLDVTLAGEWRGGEAVRTRVAPALEAVAGTLKCLDLHKTDNGTGPSDEEGVGYEWGVAVGKLRRLQDLALGVPRGRQVYHAAAQGLAASGGDRPLPLLWRLEIPSPTVAHAELLASLLLPSVRVFTSSHFTFTDTDEVALLVACALRQAGYKHTWTPSLQCPGKVLDATRALVQCRVDEGNVFADSLFGTPPPAAVTAGPSDSESGGSSGGDSGDTPPPAAAVAGPPESGSSDKPKPTPNPNPNKDPDA